MATDGSRLPSKPLSTRPPVTVHEATTLQLISESIAACATHHLEGRIAKSSLPGEPCLMYMTKTETGREAGALPLFTASQNDLEELQKVCFPAQSEDAVLDKSSSLVRELPASSFGLNVAVAPTATVSSFCQQGVEARPHTLNLYAQGGSRKASQGPSKDKARLGTLIIGLPTSYEGGALVLRQGPQSTTLDWSTKGRNGDDSLLWSFFFSDVEHEVLPITSGRCLTLVFDVVATDCVKYWTPIALQTADVKNTALYTNLRKALRDAEFLPNGGKLAFGLAHKYPHVELQDWEPFDAILKGTDRILWQVLTELGMAVNSQAAYSVDFEEQLREGGQDDDDDDDETQDDDEETQDDDGETRYHLDRFSSVYHDGDRWGLCALMTSDSFEGIDRTGLYEDTEWNRLSKDAGAEVVWDLVWVTRPKEFVIANTYATQEGCDTSNILVAGALLVDVPLAGEGCRVTSAL